MKKASVRHFLLRDHLFGDWNLTLCAPDCQRGLGTRVKAGHVAHACHASSTQEAEVSELHSETLWGQLGGGSAGRVLAVQA